MKRRSFLKGMGCFGLAHCLPLPMNVFAAPGDYTGRFLITVQAEGGWDVTSFCDPKLNVAGEREINHWARTGEIQTAGNISYAPFGNNANFFQKHHRDMLVINGVDAQTNSHTTGVVHNWSGRVSEGFPSLTALFASTHAADLPLSYINNGGYSETARLIRYSRMDDSAALLNILNPNNRQWDPSLTIMEEDEFSRIQTFRMARAQRLAEKTGLTPRKQYNRLAFYESLQQSEKLSQFAANLPSEDELQPPWEIAGWEQLYFRQIQLALIAFQSGVASAADVVLDGFDTHTQHDNDHEPLTGHLADGLVYLWETAEQLGIADRLTVVVASDFGRTPHYNSDNGKDHWPIGSVIFMEKNAAWGNRVVGLTDEGHNAYNINPLTLQRDDNNGTHIYPKHIHHALRSYLGVAAGSQATAFQLNTTEEFDFFNPSLQTV